MFLGNHASEGLGVKAEPILPLLRFEILLKDTSRFSTFTLYRLSLSRTCHLARCRGRRICRREERKLSTSSIKLTSLVFSDRYASHLISFIYYQNPLPPPKEHLPCDLQTLLTNIASSMKQQFDA